jgi:YHS domain-containing protein
MSSKYKKGVKKMKPISIMPILVGMISLGGFSLNAEEVPKGKKLNSQTTCPIMGGKINKKFYTDVKGKRIYVCCPGCISKINKNPEKYIKKLEVEGQSVQKLKKQTTCPVMKGTGIKKELFADVKGKRIYVCCGGCIAAIKQDPDKYLKILKDEGVILENTPEKKK